MLWIIGMLACAPAKELEEARAELARVEAENATQKQRIGELEAELARMRPAYEAAKALEAAAEREWNAPVERCAADGSGFTFAGDLAALTRPELWARAGRLVPMPEGAGLRVLGIRRDSILSSCGFKNGDVLEQVNGRATDSVEALGQAPAAEVLSFQVLRAGSPVQILIRPGAVKTTP